MVKQFGGPGPRQLFPAACTSESLARCSVEAQLLFDRLIVQADDQGRCVGAPQIVRGLCMPLVEAMTTAGVERCLGELSAAGMIELYATPKGQQLIQLLGWWTWQGSPRRIYPSRWPAPPGWQDRVRVEAERLHEGSAGRGVGSGPPLARQDTATGPPLAPYSSLLISSPLVSRSDSARDPAKLVEGLTSATLGDGLRRMLTEQVERHGAERVAAAITRVADACSGRPTARQLVFGAEDLLSPTLKTSDLDAAKRASLIDESVALRRSRAAQDAAAEAPDAEGAPA